jgi:4-amino-4-deoxy-L-arabinose transferase-like glycosyltransferase
VLTRWGIPVGLFLLALAVRLPGLGRFLTPDEFLWADRSRNFLIGLLNPAYVCESPTNHTGFEQAVGLACTLRTGHPGVTTMWTGSLGILLRYLADGAPGRLVDYALAFQTNPLDPRFIVPLRLPTVLLTSLWVAAMYWLVWRLLDDRRVALAAGLLLALDPFHAAFSRVIHHDALSTTFMTLSLLMALFYWGRGASRRWLVASGILAGLAFLSKSPALFLNPFIALIGFWALWNRRARGPALTWRDVAGTLGDGLAWFGCAAVTFVVLWPAMWVIPLDTLRTVFVIGSKYASGGHAKGNYFLGTVSQDPGPLFYPVTWLLRSSPLVWVGLVAAAVSRRLGVTPQGGFAPHSAKRPRSEAQGAEGVAPGLRHTTAGVPIQRGQNQASSYRGIASDASGSGWLIPSLGALLLYVVLFVAFMTWGEKKQDRYILSIYPVLSIVAAVGLVWAVKRLFSGPGRLNASARQWLLVPVILLVQGTLVVANYPYYLTYYNPLLGGLRGAQRWVTIGWGEGLDLAADYLNHKPDAQNLRVSAWYQSTFAPYFAGEAISYSQEKGKAMAGDYVVFYINQLQRRFPDDELFRYFETRYTPDQVIPLKGVDYAVIYPAPHIQHYVEDQVEDNQREYQGIAGLLGWDWPGADDPNQPAVAGGAALPFRLYWEYLGKQPEEQFFFRLLGADGRVWAEGVSQPVLSEDGDPATWRQGQIITEQGQLDVPAGTPPGEYRLQIGFYTQAPAVTQGKLTFGLPPGEDRVEVLPAASEASGADLPLARRLDVQLGALRLLGTSESEMALLPDRPWTGEVYWQATAAPEDDYQARLSLVDGAGQTRWIWDAAPLVSFYPSTHWHAGEVVRSQVTLTPTPRTPGGDYDLVLTLLDSRGKPLGRASLGPAHVGGRARSFDLPPATTPASVTFGDGIELAGFDFQQPRLAPAPGASSARTAQLRPGEQVAVALAWRALAPVEADYTLTLQLLGPDGQIYGQRDAPPLDGAAPTSTWSPGEIVTEIHTLAVAQDAPAGEYRLLVGWYMLGTGERLPVRDGTGGAPANEFFLPVTFEVGE